MKPEDMPPELRDLVGKLGEKILRETGGQLASQAFNTAMLGSCVSYLLRTSRKPGEPIESAPTAMVLLLSGPIPDDVCESLERWMRATQQDLATSGLYEGKARIVEERDDGN